MTTHDLLSINHEFITVSELQTPLQIDRLDNIPDFKLTVTHLATGRVQDRFFRVKVAERPSEKDRGEALLVKFSDEAVLTNALAELLTAMGNQVPAGERLTNLKDQGLVIDRCTVDPELRLLARKNSDQWRDSTLLKNLVFALSHLPSWQVRLLKTGMSILAAGDIRRYLTLTIASPEHDYYPKVSGDHTANQKHRPVRAFSWDAHLHGEPVIIYLAHHRDMTPTGGYQVNAKKLGEDLAVQFNARFPFLKDPLKLVDESVAWNTPTPEDNHDGAIMYNVYRHVQPRGRIDLHINWPAYQFAQVWDDHPLIKKFGRSFGTDQVLVFDAQVDGGKLTLPNGYYTVLPRGQEHDLVKANEDEVIDDYLSIINTQPVHLLTFRPNDKTYGHKKWSIGQVLEYSPSHRNERHVMRAVVEKNNVTGLDHITGKLSIDGLALL